MNVTQKKSMVGKRIRLDENVPGRIYEGVSSPRIPAESVGTILDFCCEDEDCDTIFLVDFGEMGLVGLDTLQFEVVEGFRAGVKE